MTATFTRNEAHKGLEISFTKKPEKSVLDSLKAEGFRWHSVKKLWYAKETESRLRLLQTITGTQEATEGTQAQPTQAQPQKNKFNVKVGDLFYSSWGYDQTNIDFFQVVALVGSASVRVRQVFPRSERINAYSDGSTEDTYYNTGELLPASPYSVFIEDQEKGDLKRLKSWASDGISNPQFKLDSFANAYKVEGKTITLREDHGYR
jgi:hypothetical protein